MGAGNGDIVTIHYSGKLETGEEFDSTRSGEPVIFMVGAGEVIGAIDKGVVGLEPGDRTKVVATPENAYGEHKPDLIRNVPRNLFDEQNVEPGELVEIQTEDEAIIAEVVNSNGENIALDLNHPLAGQSILFEIEMVAVKKRAA